MRHFQSTDKTQIKQVYLRTFERDAVTIEEFSVGTLREIRILAQIAEDEATIKKIEKSLRESMEE